MRHPRWRTAASAALLLGALGATRAEAYEQEVKKQAEELAERIQRAGRKRVAVVDFVDLEGNVTQLGRFLAEELSVTLSALPVDLEVIDRNHLATLLKEKKLSAEGLVDPSTTRRLGEILGVDVLVTGSLTSFGESVRVTTKALDAATAKMIAASRVDVAKVETIRALLSADLSEPGTAARKPPRAKTAKPPQSASVFDELPRVLEQNKFSFELKGCELTGRTAVCKLAVTNLSPERRTLSVTGSSRLYDDNGNVYRVADAAIANVEGAMPGERSKVSMPLHHDVAVILTIAFRDLAPDATRVSALEITCRAGTSFVVTFKGVAFLARGLPPALSTARRAGQRTSREACSHGARPATRL